MKEQITEEAIQQEVMEQMKQDQEDESLESQEDGVMTSSQYGTAYGEPQGEALISPSSFLHKAAFETDNTLRTTYLTETELGKPLFSVRFLLDLHNISNHYLNPLIENIQQEKNIKMENKIANYFAEKIKAITGSGMSNEGFAMNLNVTKKVDSTRRRARDMSNLKQFQSD